MLAYRMTPAQGDQVEVCTTTCPECGEVVEYRWCNGLLPGDYQLVADWVFHDACWDRVCERHPM